MNEQKKNGLDRRQFLKLGTAGAALAGVTAASLPQKALAEKADQTIKDSLVKVHDKFPNEVGPNYKAPRAYDTVFASAFFGKALQAAGKWADEEMMKEAAKFRKNGAQAMHRDEVTCNQVAMAATRAAWILNDTNAGASQLALADMGVYGWEQSNPKSRGNKVHERQHKFDDKKMASAIIKRVARMFGADLVGITRRDPRWDYREFFNPVPPPLRRLNPGVPKPEEYEELVAQMKGWNPKEFFFGWEKYPFNPKTVIVMAFEEDYEAISTSPSNYASIAVGNCYSRMSKTAYQLSVFLKQLGYHATAAGNDTGLSIPYAIAAGLGEGARSGLLVTYKFGPRVRIAKVYTDLDFVEYDQPKTFGVEDFCRNCMRCAESCPSKAIPFDKEPTFAPTHSFKHNPYFNAVGIRKWYVNTRECFKTWAKQGHDCNNCIASCPYNKPDFWHHRLVRKMGKIKIDSLHEFLKQMDIAFGYGDTYDEKAIQRFLKNHAGREYNGGL